MESSSIQHSCETGRHQFKSQLSHGVCPESAGGENAALTGHLKSHGSSLCAGLCCFESKLLPFLAGKMRFKASGTSLVSLNSQRSGLTRSPEAQALPPKAQHFPNEENQNQIMKNGYHSQIKSFTLHPSCRELRAVYEWVFFPPLPHSIPTTL